MPFQKGFDFNKLYIAPNMKSKFLFGFLVVYLLCFSETICAQKVDEKEENYLKFQEYFFEALKQNAINNFSKAIENLESCYEIDSINKAVEFEFSKNFLELKKYVEAEYFIDKALQNDPNNLYLLSHKVLIFKGQQNFSEAIEIQKKIVEINPVYADELVLLYLQIRDFNKAKDVIAEIEKNALTTSRIKGFKRYISSRENNLKKKTTTKSSGKREVTSDLNSLKNQYKTNKNYKLLQQILVNELENNLFSLLFEDSKDGLELFPSQPFLYQMNGLALNKIAKYNEAIGVLTIGIDFVIDNKKMEIDFYEQLSISYEGIGNKKEALKFSEKAKKLREEK